MLVVPISDEIEQSNYVFYGMEYTDGVLTESFALSGIIFIV